MSTTSRDLIILGIAALVARAIGAFIVDWPAFTDPAYYSLIAQRLADGHGFTAPVLWSFLEVGGRLPEPAVLPVPSHGHWMPLTSIIAAGSMLVFGTTYAAGTVPLVLLSALLVPFTYLVAWELFGVRWQAIAAAILAVFAGPLFILYPSIDNFAVFGMAGAGSLYASMRAVRAASPWPWLIAGGALAGLATLSRIDGVLLTTGVAAAWFVRRRLGPGASVASGFAAAAAFLAVLAPWLIRNVAVFGSPLPSAGGHTLWITSYNQQFSIGHEVSLSTYLDWGAWNIIGSKLESWLDLIGRSAGLFGGIFLVFFVAGLWIFRRRADLAPFFVYFGVMFFVMGAVFTFHAPKGAFYHSAPAWLPWAFAISVAAIAPAATAAGRFWRFLARPRTHVFITVAGLVGAIVLSVVGSAMLFATWDRSRQRDAEIAEFLLANADRDDTIMASDPASIYPLTGNPGIAAPFDPFRVIEQVVRAYAVEWVVVLSPGNGDPDPLRLWEGADGVDSEGAHPTFLPADPAFEGTDVRIYRVVDS